MKGKTGIIAALVVCGLSTASASIYYATDAPDWRGDEGTTHQAWGFDNANNPADLETGSDNEYGTPRLDINDPFGLTVHMPDYATTGGTAMIGLWKLYAGTMEISIPNTGNTDPDSWKEILIQITYYDPNGIGGDVPLVFDPPPAAGDSSLLAREAIDTYLYHDTYKIILRPNPTYETVTISPIQCQLYVDEVVIDTICIPEPASIIMLAGTSGLIAFIRRRVIA